VPPDPSVLPISVTHRDPSGPFAVEATVVAWQEDRLTLGAGTLYDADKGAFPLAGLELSVRVAHGRIEPVGVRNPGALSEFQQDGLLDAVCSALNALAPPLFRPPQE
jgi:hypothetical protein